MCRGDYQYSSDTDDCCDEYETYMYVHMRYAFVCVQWVCIIVCVSDGRTYNVYMYLLESTACAWS